MMHIFKFLIPAALLMGCSHYDIPATEYNDPITLFPKTVKGGIQYIKDSAIGVFYATRDGYDYHYVITESVSDNRTAKIFAKYECEQKHNRKCELIAINDRIEYKGVVIIAGKSYRYGERINPISSPELLDLMFNDAKTDIENLTAIIPDIYDEMGD